MAWNRARRDISNRTKRVCPAGWAAQHVLSPFQVGQDLLGSYGVVRGEVVIQGTLLYGTIYSPQIIDTSASCYVIRCGRRPEGDWRLRLNGHWPSTKLTVVLLQP